MRPRRELMAAVLVLGLGSRTLAEEPAAGAGKTDTLGEGEVAEGESTSLHESEERDRRVLAKRVSKARGYTLARCLELAERNYPKIAEARAKLARMEAQLSEARTAPFAQFEATAGLGFAPSLRGTALYSPNSDVSLDTSMGLGWRVGIEGVVPLWTFGKITNLVTAAERQTKVGQAAIEKEKNDLRHSVRRAYYGVQLARDALALIDDAARLIEKHLNRLQKRVDEDDGDDIELIKLKMYRAELSARSSEARRQANTALAGLRFYTGTERLDVVDEPLKKVRHRLNPLARYLTAARLHRPEVNMARAGVLAREAQVSVERSRYFPDFGVGIQARWARAPLIDDQVNPFVRDDANFFRYGAALVMRWKLDFWPTSARVAQAEAQLEAQRATERYALGGVGVEVETAFGETREAEVRLEAYLEAFRFAKQWLIKIQQGIDVGTYEDEDIVDPAKEYALKKFAVMSATFDYNLAVSKLASATGWAAVVASE
jgi:outer membrane protein TolC